MQRLERENLLEGYIQGAQGIVLGAAQAAGNELLVLAQLAVRLVLVVQLKDLAEQGVVGLAVRYMVVPPSGKDMPCTVAQPAFRNAMPATGKR